MSSKSVLISPASSEVLFDGCLMKAPPLNRRGRKKWHERYFILKANRTLECYKSKKAAGAQKSPRRIVDLRECINLEIGLEYKSLQHIMSLGTFKRTFFYAAPSAPSMLQWADVLEKAKNAEDGDFIEVLDIGLRRSKDVHPTHTAKSTTPPSSPLQTLQSLQSLSQGGSPKRTPQGKNGMALSHFMNGSTETMDLRTTTHNNTRQSSTSTSTDDSTGGSVQRYPSEVSTTSLSSSATDSPARTMSGLGSPQAIRRSTLSGSGSGGSGSTAAGGGGGVQVTIPNKVPPPSGFLVQASRDKDGFFVNRKRKDYRMFLEKTDEISSPEEVAEKEFVPREGTLTRNTVIKGKNILSPKHPRTVSRNRNGLEANGGLQRDRDQGERLALPSNQGTATLFHSNLKRSFRYRKIALRKEFESPLFATKETSDSEDEGDDPPALSSVPGPADFSTSGSGGNAAVWAISNLSSMPDGLEISNTDLTEPGPHINDSIVQRRFNQNTASTLSFAGYSPGNSYSKVTVTGTRRSSSSSLPGKRPLVYLRSTSKEQASAESPTTPRSLDDSCIILPPPMFAGEDQDVIDLPSRPPSNNLQYGSQTSLDILDVDPPDMFSSVDQPMSDPTSPGKSKRKLSRTRKIGNNAPSSLSAEGSLNGKSDAEGDAKKPKDGEDSEENSASISEDSKHHANQSTSSSSSNVAPAPDRDSTESSDTGYTSSTSPGYSEQTRGQKPKLNFPPDGLGQDDGGKAISKAGSLQKTPWKSSLRSIPSLNSLTSISSEMSRFYIPLVFHSPRVEGAGVNQDPNLFSVQVCLVENTDELIKDLVALKSLESFSIMESDEIHGMENVAAAQYDDFTVQTSLEDLEFGFSVTKSTQKDLFMRKVRQFTFEIKNLFGSSKPFSCDVEIRHADQLTVLPIEAM